VIGVFRAGDSAANSEILADLNQLRGDFEQQGGSSSLLVRARSPSALESLSRQIADDQRLGSGALSESAYYAAMTSSGLPLQILGFSVAVIMAVGSAFAATNTMYAAVARRSKEIGTLRALGFGRRAILLSFMLESVFLAMLGGIAGVLLALPINGLTTGVGSFSTFSEVAFKFKVGPGAILGGLAFAALIAQWAGSCPPGRHRKRASLRPCGIIEQTTYGQRTRKTANRQKPEGPPGAEIRLAVGHSGHSAGWRCGWCMEVAPGFGGADCPDCPHPGGRRRCQRCEPGCPQRHRLRHRCTQDSTGEQSHRARCVGRR